MELGGDMSKDDFEAILGYSQMTKDNTPDTERAAEGIIKVAKMISTGRCARVSYMRQGQGDVAENVKLHDGLAKGGHWSPFEHVATPMSGFRIVEGGPDYAGEECPRCTSMGACKRMTKTQVIFAARGFPSNNERCCMRCALGHITSGNFHGW